MSIGTRNCMALYQVLTNYDRATVPYTVSLWLRVTTYSI